MSNMQEPPDWAFQSPEQLATVKREYWRISSAAVGQGPLYETKAEADNERDEMLEGDPSDTITVVSVEMTPKEYAALPEFPGY